MKKSELQQAFKEVLSELMILPNNKATMEKLAAEGDTETAPTIAPPKPGTKPNSPPKREKFPKPNVQPRPKAKLEEGDEELLSNKIAQRYQKLKYGNN